MRKVFLFTFFITQFLFFIQTKAQILSPDATFSLVTISTGTGDDEIYQIWGHTVLRLNDPANGIDLCFDYGTFDFNKEGFIIKFIQGTLPYQMAVYDFQPFIRHYQEVEKRSAEERILNLSAKQKNDLYAFLNNNYLPKNREYHYRFFYYNCASRLRDIVQQICGDSLKFSTTLHADSTYRQWIERYSGTKKPWMEFGMDIALGEPSDQKTGAEGAMFLPQNLADGFDKAVILKDGKPEPFVLRKTTLTQINISQVAENHWLTPLLSFSLLLVLVIILTYWQLKNNVNNLIFDKILFSLVGLFGWLIFFMWFFTDHGVTAKNLNIIWAFPLLFPIALLLRKTNNKSWLATQFLAYGIIQIGLLISWKFLPQGLHVALIPLILILTVRAFYVWWKTRQN